MPIRPSFPIPQNPIEESFAWRDWLQKLSNRVSAGSSGAIVYALTTVTAATYTVLASDCIIQVSVSPCVVTLLPAASAVQRAFYINNASPGSITVDTTGGELINGLTSQALPASTTMQVFSDGTGWYIL